MLNVMSIDPSPGHILVLENTPGKTCSPEPSVSTSQSSLPDSPEEFLEVAPESASQGVSQRDEQPVTPAELRIAAMNFLARREHSLHELKQKLKKRFNDHGLIHTELQRLVEENLQSDDRYADSYLRSRSGRGFGPVRIRQEMRERGLDDIAVGQAMSRADIDWFEVAQEAYRKKFGVSRAEELKEKARRIRFMEYRGFTSEHFQHFLEEKRL
jgi:regulatory protein